MTLSEAITMAEGSEEVSEGKQIEAWQYLIDTGMAWKLESYFKRQAKHLIKIGVCHT